ncbi:MAG TPA: hypothetical protein VK673_21810 [Chthoniobacterales bacterium]|nr:hypothetical protein [Chthoniobacterales bacterium]
MAIPEGDVPDSSDVTSDSDYLPEAIKREKVEFQYNLGDTDPRVTQVLSGQSPAAKPQPPSAPSWRDSSAPTLDQISGIVSTFADPTDIARYQRGIASGLSEEDALKIGDNGIGSKDLGTIDTTKAYGVAVPRSVLERYFGNDPAAWRRARAVVNMGGQNVIAPIVDEGPGEGPQARGVVADLTNTLSRALKSDGYDPADVSLLANAGPDYLSERDSWNAEQDRIRKQFYGNEAWSEHVTRTVEPYKEAEPTWMQASQRTEPDQPVTGTWRDMVTVTGKKTNGVPVGAWLSGLWDQIKAHLAAVKVGDIQSQITQQVPDALVENQIAAINASPYYSQEQKDANIAALRQGQQQQITQAKADLPKALQDAKDALATAQKANPDWWQKTLGGLLAYSPSLAVGPLTPLQLAQTASAETYGEQLDIGAKQYKKLNPNASDEEVMTHAVAAASEAARASGGTMLALGYLPEIPLAGPLLGRIAGRIGIGAATMEVANTAAQVDRNAAFSKFVDKKQDMLEGLRDLDFHLNNLAFGGILGSVHGLGEIGKPSYKPIQDRVAAANKIEEDEQSRPVEPDSSARVTMVDENGEPIEDLEAEGNFFAAKPAKARVVDPNERPALPAPQKLLPAPDEKPETVRQTDEPETPRTPSEVTKRPSTVRAAEVERLAGRPEKAWDELSAGEQNAVIVDWANRFNKAFQPYQKWFDALGVQGVRTPEGFLSVEASPEGRLLLTISPLRVAQNWHDDFYLHGIDWKAPGYFDDAIKHELFHAAWMDVERGRWARNPTRPFTEYLRDRGGYIQSSLRAAITLARSKPEQTELADILEEGMQAVSDLYTGGTKDLKPLQHLGEMVRMVTQLRLDGKTTEDWLSPSLIKVLGFTKQMFEDSRNKLVQLSQALTGRVAGAKALRDTLDAIEAKLIEIEYLQDPTPDDPVGSIQSAYEQIKQAQQGLSAVSIGQLAQRSKVSMPELHDFLRQQAAKGNADLHPTTLLDYQLSPIDKGGAMRVAGKTEPVIYVTIRPEAFQPDWDVPEEPSPEEQERQRQAAIAEANKAAREPSEVQSNLLERVQASGGLPTPKRLAKMAEGGETLTGEMRRIHDAWKSLDKDTKLWLRKQGIMPTKLFRDDAPAMDEMRGNLAQSAGFSYGQVHELLDHVEQALIAAKDRRFGLGQNYEELGFPRRESLDPEDQYDREVFGYPGEELFRSNLDIIASSKHAEELVQDIHGWRGDLGEWLGKYFNLRKFYQVLKRRHPDLSKELDQIGQYYDKNKLLPQQISPEARQWLVKANQGLFRELADEMKRLGAKVWQSSAGTSRLFKGAPPDAVPLRRRMRPDVQDVLRGKMTKTDTVPISRDDFTPAAQKIYDEGVREGYFSRPMDLYDWASTYRGQTTDPEGSMIGSIERAREAVYPTFFYTHSPEAMLDTIFQQIHDVARIKWFGQKLPGMKDKFDLVKARINADRSLPEHVARRQIDAINQFRDAIYGRVQSRTLSRVLGGITSRLAASPYTSGKIGVSLPFMSAPYIGAVNEFRGLIRYWFQHPDAVQDLRDNALKSDPMVNMYDDPYTVKRWYQRITKATSWELTAALHGFVFDMGRAATYHGAKLKLEEIIKQFQRDPYFLNAKTKQMRDFVQGVGFDEHLFTQPDVPQKLKDRFAREVVNDLVTSYRHENYPGWFNTPIGRVMVRFAHWSADAARVYTKYIVRPTIRAVRAGDWRLAARYLGQAFGIFAASVIGSSEAVRSLQGIFGRQDHVASIGEILKAMHRDQPEAFWMIYKRLSQDIFGAPVIGIYGDVAEMVNGIMRGEIDTTHTFNPFMPPTVALLGGIVQTINTLAKQGYSLTDPLHVPMSERQKAWFASQWFTLFKGYYDLAENVGGKVGVQLPDHAEAEGHREFNFVRSRVDLFYELHPEAPGKPSRGFSGGTPHTPYLQNIEEALLSGNVQRAKDEVHKYHVEQHLTDKQLLESVKDSVSDHRPIPPGKTGAQFWQWAKEALPKDELDRILRIERLYVNTAKAANIPIKQ